MVRTFGKYHCQLSLIGFLPLLVILLTEVALTVLDEWLGQKIS